MPICVAVIPVPMIVDLFDLSNGTGFDHLGKHAIAVTGFSLSDTPPIPYGPTNFLLRASRIDRLYGHDDGVGPFARMLLSTLLEYTAEEADGKIKAEGTPALCTSWRDSRRQIGGVYAVPNTLLIPLYHKIRIPFRSALTTVIDLDNLVEWLRQLNLVPLSQRLIWDIYLTTVNEFKEEFAHSATVPAQYRREVLLQAMPRFIWQATAESDGVKVLDLLFDATDIEQGSFFVRAVEYDVNLAYLLRSLAKTPSLVGRPKTEPLWKVLQWFAQQQ